MKRSLLLLSLSLLVVGPVAFAEPVPTISVFASPAPNFFGSPGFAGWAANAINALANGLTSVGDPATDPTAYYQVTQATDTSNIVTSFNSWNGLANPTGAFSSQLGNRLQFGFDIEGNGTKISFSEVSFNMSSSDPGDILTNVGNFSTGSYSAFRVGEIFGPSGPTFITSGPGTQMVDRLLYVGVGNALADGGSCTGTDQSTINCVAAQYDAIMPFSLTTDYTLNYAQGQSVDGSATVDFVAPEPDTLGLLGLGLAGLGLVRYRRRAV